MQARRHRARRKRNQNAVERNNMKHLDYTTQTGAEGIRRHTENMIEAEANGRSKDMHQMGLEESQTRNLEACKTHT
jgi:hypothetical protein